MEIGCFEGNKAETLTLLPVIAQFQARHQIAGMVIVADAGMLSATNLHELDAAGLGFIVGSRTTKAPIDLESHYRWHGDYFTDGQIIDTITPRAGVNRDNDPALKAEPVWNPRTHTSSWRAVWAYSATRAVRTTRPSTPRGESTRRHRRGEDAPNPEVRHRQRQRPHPRRGVAYQGTQARRAQGLRHQHPPQRDKRAR